MGKSDVVAHSIRFYSLETRAIHCMALEKKEKKLAVSRSDNSIEIWDVQYTPYLQKVIYNTSATSIEDIKWYNNRLFSCGFQGCIVEYDCLNESVLYSFPVTGGPVWCMDVNSKRKLLACGTEDGYINILELGEGKLEHLKFLDKQQGRILCLCWDHSGQHLVTGSMDVIRVWNVDTGHAIHKMKTGRTNYNKETVVWCVSVLSDFTIISGDSRGYLCFWDGKVGAQIESNNSHSADILSLVVSDDEAKVFCAGVDPIIVMYGKVLEHSGGRRKWAKGGQRRIHEHDVRALALSADNKLYSGGIDGYLALSVYPPKILLKFPPLLKGPCVTLVPSKRYVLLRYLSHLELWKISEPEANQDSCDSLLRLKENEVLLLQLKAKKNDVVTAASISDDAKFLAYSTERGIHFFKFVYGEKVPLTKLPDPSDCGPCKLIQFCRIKNRHFCAVVTNENEINILEIEESGPDVVQTIRPLENKVLTDTISHLTVSPDSYYLIVADCKSNIGVWLTSNWNFHCALPRHDVPVTSIAVRKGTHNVVVAYSNLKIVEFDLKEEQYTDFSKSLKNNFSGHLHSPINSLTFDSRRNSSIIFHDDSSICVIDKNKASWKTEAKQAKLDTTLEDNLKTSQKESFNIIKKSKHIVSIGWLEGEEMAIVSVCPLKLAENLPPTLARKLYGT